MLPYTTQISVEALEQQLEAFLVIDCRFSLADTQLGEQQYLDSHIPGARYAHLDTHLSSPITADSGRHPLPDFDDLLESIQQWGINNTTQVVVYDDAGGSYASRLWWLLRALGHNSVAILNGGWQAWLASGHALETQTHDIQPGNFTASLNRDTWWDVNELQKHLTAKDCVLIDARAKERFAGINEPIDPVAGRIPGAVNLNIADNLDPNGFLLDAKVLRKNYLKVIGDADPAQVVHSCGSGVFACFGIFAMEVAGLEGSRLYPGSWSEWIRDPERGIERG